MVDNGHRAKPPESPSNIKLSGQSGLIITGWRGMWLSASESVVQCPSLLRESGAGGVGCWGVDLGRHPQMGAGGHRAPGVHLERCCGWVSVKTVPSKATSTRQHISGADRFISAVFQAASSRGGSPWRWGALCKGTVFQSEGMRFVREPDAGNPHVRFDERGVETEVGWG